MGRLYIAYGSNLSQLQMAVRCPTATIVGTSVLNNWRLFFDGPASIEPKKGYKVPVIIWDIKETDEKSLDRYEGYPNYYKKEILKVEVNGKEEEAMVYIMDTKNEFSPTPLYYKTLKLCYELYGFDEKILEKAFKESMKGVKK